MDLVHSQLDNADSELQSFLNVRFSEVAGLRITWISGSLEEIRVFHLQIWETSFKEAPQVVAHHQHAPLQL